MSDTDEPTNWSYYIYTIAICIILIIIGFFFFFFMPSSTVYYERKAADWTDLYSELLAEVIKTNHANQSVICIYGHRIKRSKATQADTQPGNVAVNVADTQPDTQPVNVADNQADSQPGNVAGNVAGNQADSQPVNVAGNMAGTNKKSSKKVTFTPEIVEPFVTDKYPKLYERIRAIPLVHYAGLLILKPDFTEKTTHGYAPVANNTLRYFYPFKVSAARKCGITVDGQRKFFNEGVWVCADVSREHSLFNQSLYENSIILFIDISRENVPLGISTNNDILSDVILAAF
jgi:hypothetical protein